MATCSQVATRWALAVAALVLLAVAFVAGRASTVSLASKPVSPGPYRSLGGVTYGFARTSTGADAAAAHYLLEIERAMDTLNAQRTGAVATLLATPAEASAIAAHASSVIALEQGHGVPLRRVAISTDLVGYSPTGAEVVVLESWIYATSAQEALWAIERVSLSWQHGGWRISAITGGAPSANESLADLRTQLSFLGPGDATVR